MMYFFVFMLGLGIGIIWGTLRARGLDKADEAYWRKLFEEENKGGTGFND